MNVEWAEILDHDIEFLNMMT